MKPAFAAIGPAPATALPDTALFAAASRMVRAVAVLCFSGLLGFAPTPRAWSAEPGGVPVRGEVVFRADFEGADPLGGWSGGGEVTEGDGAGTGRVLAIRPPAVAGGSAMTSIRLPVERLRGCLVRGSVRVKAREVSAPPKPWNGIKCMLAIEAADRKLWPQATIEAGTFDWRRVAFSVRVPTNATSATLLLGLEAVTGSVWFDDVQLVIAAPPADRAGGSAVGRADPGHGLPRLRGTMIGPRVSAADLAVLGREWNANLIRWQLNRPGRPGQPAPLETYDAWLEGELQRLDAALPWCRTNGLLVVLDLHSPPGGKATSGGYVGSDDRLFTDPACQRKFVEVWERMATRYRGERVIWGFDLANEPVEDLIEEGCDDWQGLATRAARAVRAVDPERTLIVEPAAWGGPDGLADLVPLPFSNVVYSVHMYAPHAFTHQGVYERGTAWRYPGVIEGKAWDKAALEAVLAPVVAFQKQHGVPIYIGEFSAIRWAPEGSAARYLADAIEIFEAHGWDWSYHAFREWHGWSVEHGSDRDQTAPATSPTDRQELLRRWFGRNQKPAWSEAAQ